MAKYQIEIDDAAEKGLDIILENYKLKNRKVETKEQLVKHLITERAYAIVNETYKEIEEEKTMEEKAAAISSHEKKSKKESK